MKTSQAGQTRQFILALWVFLLLFPFSGRSQNTISGTIRHLEGKRVQLMSIYGERTRAIDSAVADPSGRFRFTLVNRLPGMYRISWGKDRFVDVIWNQENVDFRTTETEPGDSLDFTASVENRINMAYLKLDRMNQDKLQLLMPVVDYYPEKDAFYRKAAAELEGLQRSQQRFLDSLIRKYPDAYAIRIAKAYQTPFIPASLSKDERLNLLKQHYFDKLDFSDTSLLRSMVLVNKAIAYLSLYSNNRLSQKQLEAEFIKAVTVMLGAASVNPTLYKFWLDYLVGGFDKYHFDEVITYIADNFKDPSSCEDSERKSALQKKLDTFKKIAVGKVAPDLEVPDTMGKAVKLASVDSEFTLLVFYATTCPHCMSMMPRLKEIYEKQQPKRFEVMAVSIDTSRTEWTRFIREQKTGWIDVSDLKGFGGKSADDYNIYATPTMFLLDRAKTILAKPISLMELEQVLRDHNLMR
ncbi:MAG TPA: redoxin domain-containing protein [Bacteroidales bacterium]|nr:redoxin domain-containing protein [Bacteroidales bacterium]HPS61695.1 redoxin domain-containing protein [Bacteroidales bacterium]